MQATPAIAATGTQPSGSSVDSQKLVKSAREFEAMLLQSWLEKMNQSFSGVDKSQDAAHDTVNSLGMQAIAQALAARGGIGIAHMIVRQLQSNQPAGSDSGGSRASPAEPLSRKAP
jgi:Rod binding domain-containing protein